MRVGQNKRHIRHAFLSAGSGSRIRLLNETADIHIFVITSVMYA